MKKTRIPHPSAAFAATQKANETPAGRFIIKSKLLAEYIEKSVDNPNFRQRDIAETLEMAESQLSKWLSGVHNMTIKSILKLESGSSLEILNPAIFKRPDNKKAASSDNTSYLSSVPFNKPEMVNAIVTDEQPGKVVYYNPSKFSGDSKMISYAK